MNIYKFEQDVENYSWLTTVKDEDALFGLDFIGLPKTHDWEKIPVKLNTDNYLKNRPIGDFPTTGVSFIPIISERGVTHLKEFISTKVEFLPLEFEHGQFYAVNVINVIDALDLKKSKVEKYEDRIVRIIDYEFKPNLIKNEDIIFKIEQVPNMDVLVTDLFLELIDKFRLEGLACKKVWSST